MVSFAQRFGVSKKEGGGNSIQQEVILESMKDAQENLAAQVSQANSSASNAELILNDGSKNLSLGAKSDEEKKLEQEIEENSVSKLLKAIELAESPEQLSEIIKQNSKLATNWGEKAHLLSSEKHRKEYLSIVAALNMLQKMIKNPDLLKGKQISEILQQAKSVEKLQENVSKMQSIQAEKARQSSTQVMQSHTSALASDKIHVKSLSVETAKQKVQQDPTIKLRSGEKSSDILQKLTQKTNNSAELVAKTNGNVQQSKITERVGITGSNVVDITSRLRERAETSKSMGKDAVSKAHVCTSSCNHGHNHHKHEHTQHHKHQAMGKDAVSKAHVHKNGCCGTGSHEHSNQPKALGKDSISKAHVHKNGCCGTGSHEHSHQPKALGKDSVSKAHVHKNGCCGTGSHEHSKKPNKKEAGHDHDGPCSSACGHGAKSHEHHHHEHSRGCGH